jgi:hypothetical protein
MGSIRLVQTQKSATQFPVSGTEPSIDCVHHLRALRTLRVHRELAAIWDGLSRNAWLIAVSQAG